MVGYFYEQVQSTLAKYAIPASCLEFEITETRIMERIDDVLSELRKIKLLGINITIDDFGTGNSSLKLLRLLPLEILKIDKSFVQNIGNNKKDEEIIRVILALSKSA